MWDKKPGYREFYMSSRNLNDEFYKNNWVVILEGEHRGKTARVDRVINGGKDKRSGGKHQPPDDYQYHDYGGG